MRPRSATSLPVSTASTGLLCLLVGARVHCGRSDTEVECEATTTRIPHLVRDTYTCPKISLIRLIRLIFLRKV